MIDVNANLFSGLSMIQNKNTLSYKVNLAHYNAHFFEVTLEMSHAKNNQKLSLPVWTPGSYMVREFAQHIVKLEAFENNKKIFVEKINKNTFVLGNTNSNVSVKYLVYGFDSSIRAAYIDHQQAFFNGTALFLRPHDLDFSYLLTIIKPEDKNMTQWHVATSLSKVDVDEQGFGVYEACDYDTLVDCPVQISAMKKICFDVHKVKHEMVLVSDVRNFCEKRLVNDLQKLCSEYSKLFGEKLPFNNYLFISRFEEGGFGGLEHKNSSMLLCNPYSLPKNETDEPDEKYRHFLSLCSHEYFHLYNVKRLKPKELCPYNYEEESYTKLLWLFEGITAYYDDYMVKRSGLTSAQCYFNVLAKHITTFLKNPGRKMQSLADSSFDAWIKFYRPHENSFNTNVSYYLKGGLVALYLDLSIRIMSNHEKSLDDVMRFCFTHYGDEKGITEEQFFSVLQEIGKLDPDKIKQDFIHGFKEIPFAETFSSFGLKIEFFHDDLLKSSHHKYHYDTGMKLEFKKQVASVLSVEIDSPAMKAGICPGDEIVAVESVRLDHDNYNDLFLHIYSNEALKILCSRKKRLFETCVVPREKPLVYCSIGPKKDITQSEKVALEKWVGAMGFNEQSKKS